MRVNAFVSMVLAAAGLASTGVVAQNAPTPAPTRETPRPQDIEPRVNTSATPARETPTRETPRPEDLEPRVDTSATPPSSAADRAASEAAPGPTSNAAGNAAAPATAQPSRPATASGAPASGAARATGTGASSALGASPNAGAPNATAAAAAKPGAAGAKGKALDRLELDTTQITGNRELPKVLYIVPWKRSDLGDLVGKPVNSLLDEVLTPVDRDVFQRENRYYRALTPGAVENDALSAPDGTPRGPQRTPVPTNSAPAAGSKGSATYPINGVSTGSGTAASPPRDEK